MRKKILFLLSIFIIAGAVLAACQPTEETVAEEPMTEEETSAEVVAEESSN